MSAEPVPEDVAPTKRRPTERLGRVALVAAALFALLEIAAIIVGSGQHWATATVLGEAVIALTVVSFVAGLIAVVRGRGRRAGIAAVIVSVLANPLVQIAVLGLIGRS
jgi:hypothetical protein